MIDEVPSATPEEDAALFGAAVQEVDRPAAVPRRPLAVLLVCALAVRLAIAWQPLERLVTLVMPDDAFYYLQIARNIVGGHGVTFDGVEWTNGFHPLWMALLLPVYGIAGTHGPLGVHLALTLAIALDGITIWLLARTVTRVTDAPSAGIAAACWYAFNPAVLTQVTNGLETSLNLLCLAALFAWTIAGRRRAELSARWWLGFGCVAGVAMLARSDNVVPVVVAGLGLCCYPHRPRRWPGLALAAGTSAVWLAPWLLWNWRTFGRVLQTSAGAFSVVTRSNLAEQGHGMGTVVWYALRDTYVLFVRTIPLDLAGESKVIGVCIGAGVVALALGGYQSAGRSVRAFALPTVACVALVLANSLGRGTIKVWYVAPVALVVSYAVGTVWQLIAQGGASVRVRAGVGGLLALTAATGFVMNGVTITARGLYPWQAEMLAAGRWLADRTPPETVVGSFNAGIVGYTAERTVVNLDGLVNTAAADAVAARALGPYLATRHVRLIADNAYTVFHDYRRFYGEDWSPTRQLVLEEEFALPRGAWAGQHVGVYRVRPAP